MVSSKCAQVESPSPLRFLAALMPPCAQTEWERLTGTIENKSTLPPASAILMTAASPARPPPTTMILGVAAMSSSLDERSLFIQLLKPKKCGSNQQYQSNHVDLGEITRWK